MSEEWITAICVLCSVRVHNCSGVPLYRNLGPDYNIVLNWNDIIYIMDSIGKT